MSVQQEAPVFRTYSGWRRRRGIGLFGLSQWETVAATAVIVAASLSVGSRLFIPTVAVAALFLVSLLRIEGRPLWTHFHREFSLVRSRLLNRGYFVSSLVTPTDPATVDVLPGPLAATSIYEVAPSGLLPGYAVVWNSAQETVTATWMVYPHTPHLSDPEDVDVWVGSWHQFLSRLGHISQIAHIGVTVASGTESGAVVADNLATHRVSTAPAHALKLLDELATRENRGTFHAETTVSITFDTRLGSAWRRKDPESRIAETIPLVQSLARDLRLCGLSSATLKTHAELAIMMRGAFNPSTRRVLADSLLEGSTELLEWRTSGPATATSRRNYYAHDQNRTMSWVLGDAPRSMVSSNVLHELLKPSQHWKRVTFMWVPMPGDKAAKLLERELTATHAKRIATRRQRGEETQRDKKDREIAEQTAQSESLGAGIGHFTIFASTTLEELEGLDEDEKEARFASALAEVENAGNQSKLTLRPAEAHHDLVFFGSLPVGINPADATRWLRK